jgi:hypothetical protein
MAGRPRKRPAEDERRALQVLAVNPGGVTVGSLLFGHGFKLQMLNNLVRAKLAKRYRLMVRACGRPTGVTVPYMKNLAAGRRAIEE